MSNDAAIDKQSFFNRAGQWITKTTNNPVSSRVWKPWVVLEAWEWEVTADPANPNSPKYVNNPRDLKQDMPGTQEKVREWSVFAGRILTNWAQSPYNFASQAHRDRNTRARIRRLERISIHPNWEDFFHLFS